jgi:hypothetical protein
VAAPPATLVPLDYLRAHGRDPKLRGRLAAAVERRHAARAQTSGLNEEVFDALVLLAAGAWRPDAIAAGFARVQALKAEVPDEHAGVPFCSARSSTSPRAGGAPPAARRLSAAGSRGGARGGKSPAPSAPRPDCRSSRWSRSPGCRSAC